MIKCYMESGIFMEGKMEEPNYVKVMVVYIPLSHLQI